MRVGELLLRWYAVLVCFREFLLSVDLPWHLWDKCRDQYSPEKRGEMQGDTILGERVLLNFRILCMVGHSLSWQSDRGSVWHFVLGLPVRRGCTGICSGRAIVVLGLQVFALY